MGCSCALLVYTHISTIFSYPSSYPSCNMMQLLLAKKTAHTRTPDRLERLNSLNTLHSTDMHRHAPTLSKLHGKLLFSSAALVFAPVFQLVMLQSCSLLHYRMFCFLVMLGHVWSTYPSGLILTLVSTQTSIRP